jgi:hypothetical protein
MTRRGTTIRATHCTDRITGERWRIGKRHHLQKMKSHQIFLSKDNALDKNL